MLIDFSNFQKRALFFNKARMHFIRIFLLINPLMVIKQRPEYPLYSLSLTAAMAHLIYKIICDYHAEGFLIDSLILEKIKEVIHFIKKYWNFNSIKFLEKINQSKSYICELIFFTLIHILDLFIIITIFLFIFIPYIICITIFALILAVFASYIGIKKFYESLLYKYKNNSSYKKFFYFILLLLFILLIPYIISLRFIGALSNCLIYYYFRMIIMGLIYKTIVLYKQNNGFCNVMNFFWIIIIYPLLLGRNVDSNYFIYVCFKINIRYKQDMIHEVRNIFDPF